MGRGGSGRAGADASRSRFEVEDFASAFLRLDGGGTLLIEAGWASYRSPDDLMDFTVYGTDGGAELRIEGASETPVGTLTVFTEADGRNADRVVPALPGRAHQHVVEDFVDVVRGDSSRLDRTRRVAGPEQSGDHRRCVPVGHREQGDPVVSRALGITVWNEGVHEANGAPASMATDYPDGMHGAIAAGLAELIPDAQIRTAVLADPEHGLTEEVLAETDVLLWWGHIAHDRVADEVVERVKRHVLGGMGLLVLHSGALLEDLHQPARYHLLAQMAQRSRTRTRLDRQSDPSDRRRHPATSRHPAPGDVRRVLRHSDPG